MKTIRLIILTATAAALALASTASAYTVYFKNGQTQEVHSHRVEGDKVYLRMGTGEAAFDKSQLDLEKTQADLDAFNNAVARAKSLTAAGDYTGALKTYQGLAVGDTGNVELRVLLGSAYMDAKRYDEAVYELRRALELAPDWPGIHTRIGEIFYRQGNYNDAIDQYLMSLDQDKNDKEAHLGLGNCYAKQDMYEGAITELNKAIAIRPDFAAAYATLGYVHYKRSNFDLALVNLQNAIELNDRLPEAHYYLGLLYGVMGIDTRDSKKRLEFLDKSIDSFRMAVTLRRDYPEAHADLGVAFYSRGSVPRAIEEFKLALSQKPDMTVAHNNLAGIYLRQGYFDEAVTEAKKAVSLEPNFIEAYFIMGNAYANMKMWKESARAFDKYLYYSPDGDMSEEVRRRLERVLVEGGMIEKGKDAKDK